MNQYESLTDIYSTFDLSAAAFISQCGYKLTHLDRSDPRKVAFCFEKDDGLDQLLQEFWSGQRVVEPKGYFAAIRDLKAQIYSR